MALRTLAAAFALMVLSGWTAVPAVAADGGRVVIAANEPPPSEGPVVPRPGGGLTIPRDELPFSAEPPYEDDIEEAPSLQDPRPAGDGGGPKPEVHYGLDLLPPAVRATREALIAAAKTGELDSLRPLIEKTDPPPSFSDLDGSDPLDILRAESGDEDGREVLAILLDILDAGWVKVDEGTPRERYVWPYFARYPMEDLDGRQLVELFRIMTAGDFEGMKAAGSYVFFRAEIAPDGRWLAYVSGE